MKTTLNQALELAASGSWDKAWGIAQNDEGIIEGTTMTQWVEFAKAAINRRAKEKASHAREIQYGR